MGYKAKQRIYNRGISNGWDEAEKLLKVLSHQENTIKTTLRPITMTKIKTSSCSTSWQGCGRRGAVLHCWWECKLVKVLWKCSGHFFFRKLGIVLPQEPPISPAPDHTSKRCSNTPQRHLLNYVHDSFICNSQNLEKPTCSSNKL